VFLDTLTLECDKVKENENEKKKTKEKDTEKKKPSKASTLFFEMIRSTVRFFYGKTDVVGMENLPDHDAVLVANHTQMNGPIVGELYLPKNWYIWCAGEMMNRKEVPAYAFTDFWSQKPKWTHPFYKLLSHLIAPLAACIFTNARTVAVYKDARIVSTFRESVERLKNHENLLIFPEKGETNNNILYQFQENFVDIARFYYKKTGVELTFVPMYVAPKLRTMYIGQGTKFNSQADVKEEKARILQYLTDAITETARALPEHTVIPYRNIPKKHYLTNKDINEVPQ
jgi:phenylpyruvate tautomerase PptA (4-oxalocrotonate tautomerase family)